MYGGCTTYQLLPRGSLAWLISLTWLLLYDKKTNKMRGIATTPLQVRVKKWTAMMVAVTALLLSCFFPSGVAANCDSKGTMGKLITVSGACRHISNVNGLYTLQGNTAIGFEYYKSDNGQYIYYDPDCTDGRSGSGTVRWMISSKKPSTTATIDLAGDGVYCRSSAYLEGTRLRSYEWRMWCSADKMSDRELSISAPTCICKLGYSGDNCGIGSAPPACDSDSALSKQMTVSGACGRKSHVNGAYTLQGNTADGREYYVNGDGQYIYYDSNCGGEARTSSARWMISSEKPSTTATTDLAGDGGTCAMNAYFETTARTLPSSAVWPMWCTANKMSGTFLAISTPTCKKININDCIGKKCSDHGTCIDGVDGYTCDCYALYAGTECQTILLHGLCDPKNDMCDQTKGLVCPNTHPYTCRYMTTTPTITSTITTTSAATIYDPVNVDCVEREDECTADCQRATERHYAVLVLPTKLGKVCAGPTDCQPGEGACLSMDITLSLSTTSTAIFDLDYGDNASKANMGSVVGAIVGCILFFAIGGVFYCRKKRNAHGPEAGDKIAVLENRSASEINVGEMYANPLARKATQDQHYGDIGLEGGVAETKPFNGIVLSNTIGETVLDEYIEVADEKLPSGSRPAAWFVGGMNKEECKKLVRAGDAHQFLVRTSESVAHGYVICFNVDGEHIQEDIVKKQPDGQYRIRFYSKPFGSIKELVLQWQKAKLQPKSDMAAFTLGSPVPHSVSKFIGDEMTLRCGASQLSATPLAEVLGVDPKIFMVDDKVKAICDEFAKNGTKRDQENVARLLDETYRTPESNLADPPEHSPISKVMLSKEVKHSNLQKEHVLALQLYTTSCYESINKHLRESRQPNPFAITVYYISDALKRLRKYESINGGTTKKRVYHRGMRNMKLSDQFMQEGGAELACMSTTSSKAVALSFAGAKCPMLLKCISESFMSHGAEISFLSVYPGEKEVLYPPLTYLNPVKTYDEVVGKLLVTVVEVKPVYPM